MEPLIGSVLDGRFGIDVYLGGGSMADVYRGLDLEQNIPVAVKVLRPAMTQSFELVERFRREAAALAQLSHPNIVQQHGAGRDGDYVYIAMQFIDGHPLSNELADAAGPMPLERVLSIADDVCAALSYAHEHGIVHRDIKPGNILIDTTGRAILTDFGIAKVADAASMTAFAIGTPAYMSPEQCRGQAVDGRTDIYAFACVLYEMLASVKPFRGEGTQYDDGSSHAIVHEQMTREAPALRLYNPDLNPETEDVIRRAMAKSPERRQTDARLLSEQLRSAAGHRGLRALRVAAPVGVDVLLDGEVVGTGAVTLSTVADGTHVIEVRSAGHEPYRSVVAVPQTEVVFVSLVPLPERVSIGNPPAMPQMTPGPLPTIAVPAALPQELAAIGDEAVATVEAGTPPADTATRRTLIADTPAVEQPPDARPIEALENTHAVRATAPRLEAPAPAVSAASVTVEPRPAGVTAAKAGRRSLFWYVVPALALVGVGAAAVVGGLLYFGVNGTGSPSVSLSTLGGKPVALALDPTGSLYIVDYCRVRMLVKGEMTAFAGDGSTCTSDGDGGDPSRAHVDASSVSVGPAGDVYIGDYGACRVRHVSGGVIRTVAGNGTCRQSQGPGPSAPGDGGSATGASVQAFALAVDTAGALYIADAYDCRVRKVSAGTITAFAGNGITSPDSVCAYSTNDGPATATSTGAAGVATAPDGSVYVFAGCGLWRIASGQASRVLGNQNCGYAGENVSAASAGAGNIGGIAIAETGDVYFADLDGCRIRRISSGMIHTVAGNGTCGYNGDKKPAVDASLGDPEGIALDRKGNLYIGDYGDCRIRVVGPDGNIATIAGNGECPPDVTPAPPSSTPLSPPSAATRTSVVSATPVIATAVPPSVSAPAKPYAAIVARLEAPPDCLKERRDPGSNGAEIGCWIDGTPVHIEQGPRIVDGHSWWLVTAPDGTKGWMAEDYLMLSTRTILVGRSDTAGTISLSLGAVDIPPGGDLVLQLSFANHGSSSVRWTSDHVNDPAIYLSDSQNRHILSHEVGGDFSRDVPGGLPPNATFHGWHRFTLPDSSYRGPITLHYPNHGDITFQVVP